MTDECPDFDDTLRAMLNTPPTPHKQPEPPDDSDDQVEAGENVAEE